MPSSRGRGPPKMSLPSPASRTGGRCWTGSLRLVPVAANGQPAFAVYRRESGTAYHAHALQVLTVTATGIARIVAFTEPGLFASFGLPARYDGA